MTTLFLIWISIVVLLVVFFKIEKRRRDKERKVIYLKGYAAAKARLSNQSETMYEVREEGINV